MFREGYNPVTDVMLIQPGVLPGLYDHLNLDYRGLHTYVTEVYNRLQTMLRDAVRYTQMILTTDRFNLCFLNNILQYVDYEDMHISQRSLYGTGF